MSRSDDYRLPLTTLGPLGIYLNDHLAGATGGVELSRRLAGSHPGIWGERLRDLAEEIAEDRATLIAIMRRLGIPVRKYKIAYGWLGEKLGRLKFNGRVLVRSPFSSVIELEMMTLGVQGKSAAWQVLRDLADRGDLLSAEHLDHLLERARSQATELERMRSEAALKVFYNREHPAR